MRFQVELKQASGKQYRIVKQELELEGSPSTVRELLESTARSVYQSFLLRKHSTEPEQTESEGKISFGFFYNDKEVPESRAVATAMQAFEDGIAVLFIDGVRYEDLNEAIHLTGSETLSFVKLTMLSGRLW